MMVFFYLFYFTLGAAWGYMISNVIWHRRMARSYLALSVMAANDHIPTADEVALTFIRGMRP